MSTSSLTQLGLAMSSVEVAKLCEKEHKNVLRDIREISTGSELSALFRSSTYVDAKGESRPCYLCTKEGSLLLVTGYSVPHRLRLIRRWQELEEAQKPKTTGDVLVQMALAYREHEARLADHDDRIHRVEAKQTAFEEGFKFFTIMGYAAYKGFPAISLTEAQQAGRKAAVLSKKQGIPIDKVRDPRFGQVGSYHESVLEDVFADLIDGQ